MPLGTMLPHRSGLSHCLSVNSLAKLRSRRVTETTMPISVSGCELNVERIDLHISAAAKRGYGSGQICFGRIYAFAILQGNHFR
jgi:hypothetical protein